MNILTEFETTYLYEAIFSKLVAIKTKYRTQLEPDDDLWLVISNMDPKVETIYIQEHTSR